MKFLKESKNVFLGILSFLVVFGIFKLVGITVNAYQWLIVLLLILILFELMDIAEKK